jgi:hypothetical protein
LYRDDRSSGSQKRKTPLDSGTNAFSAICPFPLLTIDTNCEFFAPSAIEIASAALF